MKINRLFEIVYILIDRKTITAKELADKLEVSVRTIYRDIETLCESNIPIYSNKGAGGGISILPNYILNKSVLTDEEQKEILAGLQGLKAAGYPDSDGVLGKISSLFSKNQESWIDVDFSSWGSNKNMDDYFYILKDAIMNKKFVMFQYYGSNGEATVRKVEPIKLISKNKYWYIYAYCTMRKDYRIFKLSRIADLEVTNENYENIHSVKVEMPTTWGCFQDNIMDLKFKFSEEISYRIFDEFNPKNVSRDEKGTLFFSGRFPDNEDTYSYLLSYGHLIEIISPEAAVQGMKKYISKIAELYN